MLLKKKKKKEIEEIRELALNDSRIEELIFEEPTIAEKEKKKKKKEKKVRKAKNKTKKKISKKFIIFLMILLVIIASTSLILVFALKDKEIEVIAPVTTEPEDAVEKYSFSFIGVGDALLHPGVYYDAATNQRGSDGYTVYDFHHMFNYIGDVIKDYDLKFYNQETIIGGKNLGLSGYPCFNSPDEIGSNLVDIGFNIVNLASNHTLDKGVRGATYSANFWHSKPNVLAVGSYRSMEERNNIVIKEVNGISYAVLSYTYGTNGIPVPSGYEYLVNLWSTEDGSAKYEAYKEQVRKDVASVRDKVDVLLVSMHWGSEYQLGSYNNYQNDAAHFLAGLGVNAIIGTHSHVVQPVEYIGDTLVIYSLGNFISGQGDLMKKIGGIVGFTVNKTVKGGEVKIDITDVKADLHYTYHQNYNNFKIIPFSKLNDSLLYNYRSIYEQYKRYLNPKGDSRIQVGFIN